LILLISASWIARITGMSLFWPFLSVQCSGIKYFH
jgi:hypothetical protein